jgi:hypothetical protein
MGFLLRLFLTGSNEIIEKAEKASNKYKFKSFQGIDL